jgi:hypothetical protein
MTVDFISSGLDVTIGLLGAALVAAMLIALVHQRAARRTRPAVQAATPMMTAVKNVTSADKEKLRTQTAAAMRSLEINVARLTMRLKAHLIDADQVNGPPLPLRKTLSVTEDARPTAKWQRDVAPGRQTSPFKRLLPFASRNRAARGATRHQVEIGKLQAELSDKCRLLDEREGTIKQLRDELNVVREIDDELRCTNIANRSRNVAIEKKLRREISDLQAQLLEATRAHARLRRER